jgi:YebC/PmpR family DNA-binding regulatory protein
MGAQWKHKGRTENAAAKGKLFGKLVKEILVAAKAGPDPDMNPRLRMAVDQAKKASMPRDTLERAIKKGSGQLDDVINYELVTYEGFAPHQVPVIVECLTDNRTRTATNIRTLFRKGQLATAGAISWDFSRLGTIEATPPKPGTDAEAAAIEAGAQDLESADEGVTRFFTDPADLDAVSKALGGMGWKVESASLAWRSKHPVEIAADAKAEVEAFLEALDEDDDVQTIFTGLSS